MLHETGIEKESEFRKSYEGYHLCQGKIISYNSIFNPKQSPVKLEAADDAKGRLILLHLIIDNFDNGICLLV